MSCDSGLLNPTRTVKAGRSCVIYGTLTDAENPEQPLPGTAITAFTLTVKDSDTGEVINNRDGVDILNTAGGQIDLATGNFEIHLSGDDNPFIGDAKSNREVHEVEAAWFWTSNEPTGPQDREGSEIWLIEVERLTPTPAA